MGRNNRPPRPSKMAGKRSPRPKMVPVNEPDPCAVPCSSQDSAAAAESSYMYFNDDTCSDSATDFGSFLDDDDAEFSKLCLSKFSPDSLKFWVPCSSQDSAAAAESYVYFNDDTCSDSATDFGSFLDEDDAEFSKLCLSKFSPGSLKFWEDCLSEDEWVGCQSSGADWVSFEMSCGGATVPASCNNSVSLESHMNEEDPVDSLPQPLHQDENGELNDHAAKYNSEISNSCKETSVNNRPDTSVNPRNISNSIEMDYNEETSQPVSRPSSSAGGQSISLESHNSHVKFKVKSFTVPEFFVEVPKTASAGFLKKAILEKATAMVGGGGQLDVLLQVEKTGDENESFLKTIISHQNKLDVILEPEYLPNLNGSSPNLSCIQLAPQPQTWCTPSSSVVHQGTTDTSPDSFMSILGTTFQDNHEMLEMRTNVPIANSISSMAAITCSEVSGSLDLVPKCQKIKAFKCKQHLVMDANNLDVGPVQQKPNLSKNVKRRKTEFFSISEVEAMVQKVEELGTGRWQKIKEQAFGHDSRRTYMDVKDKWRSLVKTAKMSVHKRRGEKLPQVLLDKVLAIETRNSQCRDMQK